MVITIPVPLELPTIPAGPLALPISEPIFNRVRYQLTLDWVVFWVLGAQGVSQVEIATPIG